MIYDLPYIPYNSSNTDRAKENRKTMTRAEQRIRFEILQHRPSGYKFIRQKMISSFILDFYCSKLLLGIEIDGGIHNEQQEYDAQRESRLRDKGIMIIRYANEDIIYNIDGVYQNLLKEMEARKQKM